MAGYGQGLEKFTEFRALSPAVGELRVQLEETYTQRKGG